MRDIIQQILGPKRPILKYEEFEWPEWGHRNIFVITNKRGYQFRKEGNQLRFIGQFDRTFKIHLNSPRVPKAWKDPVIVDGI